MVATRRPALSDHLGTLYGHSRISTEAPTHHAIQGSGKTYDRYDMQAEKRAAVEAIEQYVNKAIAPKLKIVA